MKLQFEPDLDYQHAAIEAVCDLFGGQEINRTEFTVTHRANVGIQGELGLIETDLGIGNRLTLPDDEIEANLNEIQLRNGLAPSGSLASGDFTVEMETGTGKTYVYLRTIFELNKRFGFSKFVIVVPSVAIKEGVYKTLQMTEAHLKTLYAGQPFEFFLYDSAKIGQVRNFATSATIQIMVVTVGAINKKDVNNLYKENEKTGGEQPIDLIRATRPIVIVDEPQSVDGGVNGQGKKALDEMHPLCTLRYSATHVDKHHMVYNLDAVDAYERKLVKQIEVASIQVQDNHNKAYVRLTKASNGGSRVTARVELDVRQANGLRRKEVTVRDGDDLEEMTGHAVYKNCRIGEIRVAGNDSTLEIRQPGSETTLSIGEQVGGVDPDELARLMIRRTIKEHLEKELRLAPRGIKILSLFFVDKVDHYRRYNDQGRPEKGKYALMFEEEYRRAAELSRFTSLFEEVDAASVAEEVHNGYFSIDKKGSWTDTAENNQANRDNAERAYNLIMKDKEKLLSFDTKLKFIFSHSALKEGWDNPNVFQICALREIGSERERRQTIGRGLRLCVDQSGRRLRGFDVNTLTVIANENYERFADNLQREIEADTGIRFGTVEDHLFATIPVSQNGSTLAHLGFEASTEIVELMKAEKLIDAKGKVQDKLRQALKDDKLADVLPLRGELAIRIPQIKEILRKVAGRLEVKNADERRTVKPRETVLHSAEFQALWDRIKHKTTYRVRFDNEKLIVDCAKAIEDAPPVTRARATIRKADLSIGRGGVQATETSSSGPFDIDDSAAELPDLLTELQDRTPLTRRSLVKILVRSQRLDDFRHNPQAFIDLADDMINHTKRMALVDGIRYRPLGDGHCYAQELFEQEELTGHLKSMLLDTKKSVFEHVVYDSSGVELTFAEDLEKNESVKVYTKLPTWFSVPTPLGAYRPDWAVLVEVDGTERLYFVVETKGSLFDEDIRFTEAAKIACGKAHFQSLNGEQEPPQLIKATSVADLMQRC